MFVLVEHYITQPQAFWSGVDHALHAMPANATLHHCFPTPDGTHAICIWEAEALADVRAFLQTYVGHVSRNLFFEVENGAGVAVPSRLSALPAPAHSGDGEPASSRMAEAPGR